MSEKLRILITGFGPFPGAPFNPTQPLVARLLRLRRPAFGDVEMTGHIFPVANCRNCSQNTGRMRC
jgi:pyroglutamyl-peptidase